MENFQKASRLKLRFETSNGVISIEQLWDLKYSTLCDLEERLQLELAKFGETTRRKTTTRNKEKELVQLRYDIVNYILDVIDTEREEANAKLDAKEHNQKILELINDKKNESLKGKTIEELEAMLKK